MRVSGDTKVFRKRCRGMLGVEAMEGSGMLWVSCLEGCGDGGA